MGKRRRSVTTEVNESEGEDQPSPSDVQAKRPCSGADKWSCPEEMKSATHVCQKLYEFLRRAKDEEHRLLCECVVRVPSRRSHSHYYDIITHPIDLMRIQQKLKTDEYQYVPDFLSDIQLLFGNARRFFRAGSEEVHCVDQLEDMVTLKLQEYAGHFSTASTPSDGSPPSLTLRIPKDQLRGLSAGKTGQSGSSRLQLRTKLTRSKAWLQEYLTSEDPLKMYMAAVYEHTDPTGVCVAEVFHELPSVKDYPEYYDVITEPVDLNLIKKNLEGGRYSNLRDIQEDMILMVKNAHHFNEPGSEIYKLASTLRRFVINHCAELERIYHTVSRPLKVSLKRPSVGGGEGWEEEERGGGEERKVPKLRMKLGSESESNLLLRRVSTSEAEFESCDSESSREGSEESDEGEGEGEEAAKKTKTSQTTKKEYQLTRLLKSRAPPPLKKQALALYCHLVGHRDGRGRKTAELFMKKPSAKQYPEYYVVIRSPIDFREIVQKIKQEQYGSLEDLMSDVELLVSNAMAFNEEDSTVYQDAVILQKLARDAAHKLNTAWPRPSQPVKVTTSAVVSPVATVTMPTPPSRPRGRPRKNLGVAEMGGALGGTLLPIQSPISSLFMAIKMFTLQGRGLWRSLQNQPTVGSEARKDFSTISMKIATGKFTSIHQLYQDLHQVFDNVCQTQPADSLLHRDALILCRVAAKKYLELTTEERRGSLYPNVQEAVQSMLRSVLAKTLLSIDGASGTEALCDVVMTTEIKGDSDEPPTTHKLSLSLMEKWVGRGYYRRLDTLQQDFLSLLYHAADRSKPLRHSVMAVGRALIQARDQEVGKKGNHLWSPALSFSIQDLERKLADRVMSSEGAEPVTMDPLVREGDDSNVGSDLSSANTFDQLTVSDNTYHVGDVVYLSARSAGQKPHIVLIEKLWKDTTGDAWLQGCWYYRPEETFHLATRKFYEKEVFKSDFHSVALLSNVQGKCCVLVVRDYVRFSHAGFSEDDVFVCESRYAHKAKSFKKIKNWTYPSNWQPRLIARDVPLTLTRVPSVFMTQSTRVTGSGSQSVVPVSDTSKSSDKDLEPNVDSHSVDASLPYLHPLENVRALAVSNPTAGCTYYDQYCIDEDSFRLGDCVYVRSDQEKPFVARIDRMWTDTNGDPWFHGPWFVYPEEVTHSPTRLFFENELFISSILDTNPMRSIIGRCAVLGVADYCRKRQTELSEDDVFVVESRYQEAEREIRKIVKGSGLKQFQLSKEVHEDEVFYFQNEIQPRKVPSPKLLSHVSSPVTISPSPVLSAKQSSLSSQLSSGQTTPLAKTGVGQTTSSGGLQPTPPGGPPPTTMANVVNINPQLLQALLASVSQASTSKPVVIPLQQSPVSNSGTTLTTPNTPIQPSPQPAAASVIESTKNSQLGAGYVCLWDDCGERFDNLTDLTTHLMLNMETSHLVREMDGHFYCRWANCPRNPRHGGRSFDTMPKITRHVKEVHLLKLSQTALGLNPRSHVIQGQMCRPPAIPTLSIAPTPPSVVPLSSFSLPSTISSSPSPLPVAHIPIVTPPPVPTATALSTCTPTSTVEVQPVVSTAPQSSTPSVTSVHSPLTSQAETATTKPLQVSSIFVPPPQNKKPLVHSAIYTKYIENLQKNSHYISSLQTTDQMSAQHRPSTVSQVEVSDWLLPSAVPDNMTASDALLALRDHLLRDSLRLGQHVEQFQ